MKRVLFFGICCCLGGCQLWGTLINGGHRLYTIVADDRTVADDWADVQLNLQIRDALARQKAALVVDIEVTVFEGSVLLTGAVPNAETVQAILSAVWSVPGVRKVYNYVRLDSAPALKDTALESAVATQIKTALALTPDISSVNYKLVLENGTVYLMGITASVAEQEAVWARLKNTVGVEKIIFLTRPKMEN